MTYQFPTTSFIGEIDKALQGAKNYSSAEDALMDLNRQAGIDVLTNLIPNWKDLSALQKFKLQALSGIPVIPPSSAQRVMKKANMLRPVLEQEYAFDKMKQNYIDRNALATAYPGMYGMGLVGGIASYHRRKKPGRLKTAAAKKRRKYYRRNRERILARAQARRKGTATNVRKYLKRYGPKRMPVGYQDPADAMALVPYIPPVVAAGLVGGRRRKRRVVRRRRYY